MSKQLGDFVKFFLALLEKPELYSFSKLCRNMYCFEMTNDFELYQHLPTFSQKLPIAFELNVYLFSLALNWFEMVQVLQVLKTWVIIWFDGLFSIDIFDS